MTENRNTEINTYFAKAKAERNNSVNNTLSPRDRAYTVVSVLYDAIEKQATQEIFELRHELLELLSQLRPNERQLFRQWIYLDRIDWDKTSDMMGTKVYNIVIPLLEVSQLARPDIQTYVSLDVLSHECQQYRIDTRNRDSYLYRYTNLKPNVVQLIENTESPTLKRDIKMRIKLIERCIKLTGKSVTRRQQKSPVSAKKTAPKHARTTVQSPSSFMDRIAKVSGIRL